MSSNKLQFSGDEPFSPWPYFADDEVAAVERVLRSGKVNYWTGHEGRAFEAEFAQFCECEHAIAVANGTVALELALHGLGLKAGDEVIVPSRTFIATASCVVAAGGRPVIADVDADSQNITAQTIASAMTPRTRGIIAVHLAGWSCEMDEIVELAGKHDLFVIEDCAQAHGAKYKGRPVGSIGDAGAFSFCQDKIVTTAGEGGMLVTNNSSLWDRAWRYKDHGKTPDAFYGEKPKGNQFRWLHESFGTNMRMTEVQAAVGRLALQKLPGWTVQRNQNAQALHAVCDQFTALRTPQPSTEIEHAYYKFYTFVCAEQLRSGWDRDRIAEEIRAHGVPCFTGSCSEIYREQAFPEAWKPATPCRVAQQLGQDSLMFLVHPTLKAEHIQRTEAAIFDVLSQASLPQAKAA